MRADADAVQALIDKEAIRDLVHAYSRAIDRKDYGLLRDLYTAQATDTHGDTFDGSAVDYCNFLEKALPQMSYSGHHVCNHMISVEGCKGDGEVYALAYHVFRDQNGEFVEDFMCVRYTDNYQREADGKWRFSKRVVTYDVRTKRPFGGKILDGLGVREPSYEVCQQLVFQRGARP